MKLTFSEVNDSNMLEKVFAFRHKIITETYKEYCTVNEFIGNKESDKYDYNSVHFAGIDEDGEVCANVRLIYNSPYGYPTENSMSFDKEMFERDKLGEMSRIFIDEKFRSIKTTKIIMNELKKLMYVKLMQLGIEYTYGSLEESFLRLLKIYKIHYHTIGEEQVHENIGLRYPSILYTERLGNDNPELIELWESKVAL